MIEEIHNALPAEDSIKVLFIDLENCPNQIQKLLEDLEQYSSVVICYAQSGAKIPLDWLIPLSATIQSNKLKILKMASAGKNSADFGICFSAGALMQQLPQQTHFVISSNDTDLDHVISLLQSHGRSAERIGTQKPDKTPTVTQLDTAPPIKTYCMHLVTYSKNRPAKKDTLINSIKNKFKDDPKTADNVFQSLMAQQAIAVSENKINYNNNIIKKLAES